MIFWVIIIVIHNTSMLANNRITLEQFIPRDKNLCVIQNVIQLHNCSVQFREIILILFEVSNNFISKQS